MHPEAAAGAADMLAARVHSGVGEFRPRRCLDLGGQAINGDVRAMFDRPGTINEQPTWDILDIVPGPGVTIVADATDPGTWFDLRDQYDLVLCTEVLEHVEMWPAVLDCCATALKPTGSLILTCASTNRPPHGANGEATPAGQWYANVDPTPLELALLRRFAWAQVKYQYPPGDAYAWAYAPRSVK